MAFAIAYATAATSVADTTFVSVFFLRYYAGRSPVVNLSASIASLAVARAVATATFSWS